MSIESSSNDTPFGTLLGYALSGVAIYSSNYSSLKLGELPDDGSFRSYIDDEYMGHKWQCVEFARRFLFLNYPYLLDTDFEINDDLAKTGHAIKPISGRCGSNIDLVSHHEQLLDQTSGQFVDRKNIY